MYMHSKKKDLRFILKRSYLPLNARLKMKKIADFALQTIGKYTDDNSGKLHEA